MTARHDCTIFNASADEPGGSDLTFQVTGAAAVADASAVSADQPISNPIDVDITGAESPARAQAPASNFPAAGWHWHALYQIGNSVQQWGDAQRAEQMAETDILIIQGFNPTLASEVQNNISRYTDAKAHNPSLKILYYCDPGECHQTPALGGTYAQISQFYWQGQMINSATRGSTEWLLRDTAGNPVEHHFSSSHVRVNECVQFMDGVQIAQNSFGRNYAEQYWKEWYDEWEVEYSGVKLNDLCDGAYIDVHQAYPQSVYEFDVSPRVSTSPDYDEDGIADGKTSGGPKWRTGIMQFADTYYDYWDSSFMLMGNNAEDGIRMRLNPGFQDSLPLSSREDYHKQHGSFSENVHHGMKKSGTDYPRVFDGFKTMFHDLALVKQRNVRSGHPWGDTYGPLLTVLEFRLAINPPWRDIDLEMYRSMQACACLAGAVCGVKSNQDWRRLDESNYDLGNHIDPNYPEPTGTSFSNGMGTLNDADASFSLRATDYASGSVKAYWVEFDNAIWVLRRDYPPGGTSFGDGSPAVIPLPSAGSGKTWRHPDFTTPYQNPNASHLVTRNQSPSINDGSLADGTGNTITLLPFHARMLVRSDT
jgi:hypothetical protein